MFHFQTEPTSPSRREFMTNVARRLLGVSFLPLLASQTLAASRSGQKAKQIIYLYMAGAMSQFETFDPKPGTESQGEGAAIDTNVAGLQLSEYLPRLAKQAEKLAIVRSMSTETGAHEQGSYVMRTGYRAIASTRHPSLGPWVQKLAGKGNPVLPGSVVIGGGSGHPGSGYLGAQFMPVPIGSASRGLQNSKSPEYLSEAQFDHRMELTRRFDRTFEMKFATTEVEGYTKLYDEAIRLMRSDELRVFDINREPKKVRDAYGNNDFGQGCLLARRLVQNGVKFVEVGLGGWDDHRNLFNSLPGRAARFDQGLSTLLVDLKSQGMLSDTLVVVATEFGRTPKINENAGRDHYPSAFSCVLAGAGVNGGSVYGATDKAGKSIEKDPVTVPDFNSTIAYAMGLSHDEEIYSPDGRPFTLGNGGEPLKALFS
ncbi:MAG: DUF1501 domain-containing protein [Bythopirellula sp.]